MLFQAIAPGERSSRLSVSQGAIGGVKKHWFCPSLKRFPLGGACVRLARGVCGWHAGSMVKANKSLKARQAVRAHFEEEQQKLRDRKKKLNSLLSLLDQRDELDEKIGHASRELIELGEKKSTIRDLVGLSVKEFSDLLSVSEESEDKESKSTSEGESADKESGAADSSHESHSAAEGDLDQG